LQYPNETLVQLVVGISASTSQGLSKKPSVQQLSHW